MLLLIAVSLLMMRLPGRPVAGAARDCRSVLRRYKLVAKASAGGRLRASAPAEVSFVRTGTRSAARSDDLNAFRGLERRRTHCYIRIWSHELALKTDSNVFIRVYNSTLLGSLKTGAYGSA